MHGAEGLHRRAVGFPLAVFFNEADAQRIEPRSRSNGLSLLAASVTGVCPIPTVSFVLSATLSLGDRA
jgi:hypothetical protein